MPEIDLFGQRFLIRQLRAPRFKKRYTLAKPPPWYHKNPDYRRALSKGQKAQVIRFTAIATETEGMSLDERKDIIRASASGPTGFAKPKIKIRLPKIGPIITLAEQEGIPVPESLKEKLKRVSAQAITPTPTPTPTAPRLRT
ncbi:MAG: hypothetical protein QW607_10150 [Desulfurococcaceae archaeon]